MTQVRIHAEEWYPVWNLKDLAEGEEVSGLIYEVDEETAARWREAFDTFAQVQREMTPLVRPPCPECGHPLIRHQEWSSQWDYWGCLECRCQFGAPEERRAS